MKALLTCLFALWLVVPALAVLPDEVLSDPALEARARDISSQLRCLVCQNESIDESNADLAREIRLIVRERLVAGNTDQEVMQFLVDRYGEYVRAAHHHALGSGAARAADRRRGDCRCGPAPAVFSRSGAAHTGRTAGPR
jgi:hypothetical protein